MTHNPYSARILRCTNLMKDAGLDALLLTKPANLAYLTGDGRLCAYAMISKEGGVAIGVPSTDLQDVKARAAFDKIVGFEDEVGMIHSIAHYFEHFGIKEGNVGLEFTFLTHSMLHMLTHPHAKPQKVIPKDCTAVLSTLRIVKDEDEIEKIKKASAVAAAGMAAALSALKPGLTESMVAAEAEYAMRRAGADEFWRTYVSSGPRTNIAHGLPTQRRLEEGDLVMIDLHPIVGGYSADICRTVCLGEPSPLQRQAYDVYLQAQQEAVSQVKSGVEMTTLEEAIHGLIKKAGHGEHLFGPTLHGVGIEFEEAPLPPGHAFFHGEAAPPPLAAGTVIAVGNCGLYTGPWGVRIEDTVVVRDNGPQVLTDFRRRLEV